MGCDGCIVGDAFVCCTREIGVCDVGLGYVRRGEVRV